jgi:hypothetical protein
MKSHAMWKRSLVLTVFIVAAFIGQLGVPASASARAPQRTPVSQVAGKVVPGDVCGVPVPC